MSNVAKSPPLRFAQRIEKQPHRPVSCEIHRVLPFGFGWNGQ
jgi:hypothetical protein